MADVAVATTDSFTTKLSGAATDDTLVMAAGEHVTPSSGTARQSVNKRVVVRATGFDATAWEGKFVKDATGHLKADWPSQWRGGWSFGTAGVTVNGMLFNGRMSSGPGSVDLTANSLTFNDCGLTDEFFGYIMCHVEGLPSNIVFNRCRFWMIGTRADHDHPIYWKATSSTLGRCTVNDSIFYDHTGWAMHCYPNGDGILYKRCVVYMGNGAGVFSAQSPDATSGAGFENCLLLDAQGYGVGGFETGANPSYLVEKLDAGSGYVQDSMVVNNNPGPGVVGRIQSTANITVTNVLQSGVPLWLNGPPETTGDFRLDPNPANPALGYGPTYIQPASSTTVPVQVIAQVGAGAVIAKAPAKLLTAQAGAAASLSALVDVITLMLVATVGASAGIAKGVTKSLGALVGSAVGLLTNIGGGIGRRRWGLPGSAPGRDDSAQAGPGGSRGTLGTPGPGDD